MASTMEPMAVKSHAGKLLSPNSAREAGSKYTPVPMVLPTTRAVLIQKPSSRGRWETVAGGISQILYWLTRRNNDWSTGMNLSSLDTEEWHARATRLRYETRHFIDGQ